MEYNKMKHLQGEMEREKDFDGIIGNRAVQFHPVPNNTQIKIDLSLQLVFVMFR